MTYATGSSGFLGLFKALFLCAIVGTVGLVALAGLGGSGATHQETLTVLKAPPFVDTLPRASVHIGTDHQGATEKAYEVLETCVTEGLVFDCQQSTNGNPPGWLYICPLDDTHVMCAVGYVGYGLSRLTGWVMSCAEAYEDAAVCKLTTIEEGD